MRKNVVRFERDGWKIFPNQVSFPLLFGITLTLCTEREFNEFIEATEVHST